MHVQRITIFCDGSFVADAIFAMGIISDCKAKLSERVFQEIEFAACARKSEVTVAGKHYKWTLSEVGN